MFLLKSQSLIFLLHRDCPRNKTQTLVRGSHCCFFQFFLEGIAMFHHSDLGSKKHRTKNGHVQIHLEESHTKASYSKLYLEHWI